MKCHPLIVGLALLAMPQLAAGDESPPTSLPERTIDTRESNDVLLRAYKREFAFLEAERNALRKQLSELDARMADKVSTAQATVLRLQQEVANHDLEVASLQKELEEVENVQSNQETPEDLFSNLFSRAATALVQLGRNKPAPSEFENKSPSESITRLIKTAHRALSDGQLLHRKDVNFFNEEGVLVEGSVLKVGYVASYGASANNAGMLRPAGDGRLQLVKDAAGTQAAAAFARGDALSTLPIFLYENLEKAVQMPKPKTVKSILAAGGVIAYIIAAIGIVAILLLIIRGMTLTYYAALARQVKQWVYRKGTLANDDAKLLAKLRGPHARVLRDVMKALPLPRQAQMDAFNQSFLAESPKLDRFSAMILVLAAIAPLLGLLGTVTGMIATFDTITQFGTGNPKLLSGGISEALITTELGLIVAIPAVLFGNLLKGWAEGMKDTIEGFCLKAMNQQHADTLQLVADAEPFNQKGMSRDKQLAS